MSLSTIKALLLGEYPSKKDAPKVRTKLIDDNVITGLFLVLLSVAGNFTAETFGCTVQNILNKHMYIKHLIVVISIYLTTNFTNRTDGDPISPMKNIRLTILVYLGVIMFTRMRIEAIGFVSVLLFLKYMLFVHRDYVQKQLSDKTREKVDKFSYWLSLGIIFTLLIGTSDYLISKIIKYHTGFIPSKYIFGVIDCKNK